MHFYCTVNKIINQVFFFVIFLLFTHQPSLMYNTRNMANLLQVKTSASALVEALLELGVDSIFGYPGASVLSIYNELSKESKIKHFLVRHEQAAVHSAEGYARASGKTGVVLVTSGPGFTNTITGIANAYADSTPLVVLAGDVASSAHCEKVFQKVDIKTIAKTCCKKVFTLTKDDDISLVIKEAFEEAESGVKGPVVVALPRNFLEAEAKTSTKNFDKEHIIDSKKIAENIPAFANLVNESQNPLILIGGGCIDASEEIEQFVSALQIPVVSTLMGIGIYPSENNLYLGMIGINGTDSANEALSHCDLLIALGTAFSDRSTCKKNDFAKNCKVISVNIEPSKRKFELQINTEVKPFLQECIKEKNKFNTKTKWRMEVDLFKEELPLPEEPPHCLHSSVVLETLSEYTKYYEPIVVTDVGQHQMLTAQFFKFNKPRKFITSGSLGTMGFGLPAAVGAHIAKPENLVLNITGDGSFQMNLQELATCREHQIPVKIIIMNNSYLGMVREMQEKIYKTRYQVEMINPDFTKIAEAYDLFAVRVKKIDELIPALERAINHKGTAIVDILIDSFENI